jgi:tetratricopeptide (TPR) repeat protein
MVWFPVLLFLVADSCGEDLQPAIAALQQNQAPRALAILETVRSQCARSSAFYEAFGLANELSGRNAAAEEALQTAVRLDGKSPRLLTEFGATLLRNGKAGDAATVLNEALSLDPANPVTLKYAAGAAAGSQNWQRAAELFQRMGIDTNYASLQQEPILVLWWAQTLIETKRVDQIDARLSPHRNSMPPGLLFSLGTLFAQHGMYERAVDYLKQISPDSADDAVYFNLGLSYSHLQKFEDARQAYFEAIDRHPKHVDAYLHLGLDYVAAGELRMGVPWIFRAHSFAPDRSDIAYALVEQLIALEYFNSAKEVLMQAFAGAPHDALLSVADGDLKSAQGNPAAAITSYRRALAERPGLPAALVGLARALVTTDKVTEATSILHGALSHNPQDPFVNGELGLLEARGGNWQDALGHLRHAWAHDQSNPQIALELARAYEREHQPSSALQVLESIRPAMQESSAFHFQLAQIYTLLGRSADARTERATVTTLEARSQDVLHFENPRTYVH